MPPIRAYLGPVSYTHLDVYKRQGLGLFGSVWLGVSREKLGLLLAVIGVLIGVIDLAVNGLMM